MDDKFREERKVVPKANIVKDWIQPGLVKWQETGAGVDHLAVPGAPELSIPVIDAKATANDTGISVILFSGIHMEEISGPNILLNPEMFQEWRDKGLNFVIFPVVNQYGLDFPEDSPNDHVLRYDGSDHNYNDGWGDCDPSFKPAETYPIEEVVKQLKSQRDIKLAITLHEDSTHPEVGFISTCALDSEFLEKFDRLAAATPSYEHFAKFEQSENPLVTGDMRYGYMVVDDDDPRALENWLADSLKIPSLMVEAPFGKDLPTKVKFQKDSIDATLKSLVSET